MTDTPDKPTTAELARRAMELKAAAPGRAGVPGAGRSDERAAAARSASKSRPALRK